MPRKQKAQPRVAPQDQAYGQRGEQMAAQAQMPLPDNTTEIPSPSPAPAAAPAGPSAPQGDDPVQALLAAAQAMPPPGGLRNPTSRPNEPVTAGIAVGPGPGPEALGGQTAPVNRAAETLRLIAQVTGDQKIAAMAQRVANR